MYNYKKLGDVADFQKGFAFKSKDFKTEGYNIVKVKDLTDNSVSFDKCDSLSEELAQKHLRYELLEDDIIITTVGSWPSNPASVVGKVVKVPEVTTPSLLNQNTVRIRAKEDITQKYLYYSLKNDKFKDYIVGTAQGSANQASITQRDIKNYDISIPPIEKQVGVETILSLFDSKIENNNAIIANLEEQAQAIFKSWFVDFEPFQDEEFVESEIGNIPRNWEIGQLGNSKLGELKSSGIEDFEGEKIYIATADVEGTWINSENTEVTYEDKPSRANMQPTPYSVWFAKMKDSRKLILVDNFDKYLLDNIIFSTGFAGIQCNKLSVYYLWEFIKSNYFDEVKNQCSTGTTMQAINNKNINQILVIIPPQIVLSKFNSILHPINNKISLLKRENITLAEARDTLLPKLMSGEIRVEETIEVEEM